MQVSNLLSAPAAPAPRAEARAPSAASSSFDKVYDGGERGRPEPEAGGGADAPAARPAEDAPPRASARGHQRTDAAEPAKASEARREADVPEPDLVDVEGAAVAEVMPLPAPQVAPPEAAPDPDPEAGEAETGDVDPETAGVASAALGEPQLRSAAASKAEATGVPAAAAGKMGAVPTERPLETAPRVAPDAAPAPAPASSPAPEAGTAATLPPPSAAATPAAAAARPPEVVVRRISRDEAATPADATRADAPARPAAAPPRATVAAGALADPAALQRLDGDLAGGAEPAPTEVAGRDGRATADHVARADASGRHDPPRPVMHQIAEAARALRQGPVELTLSPEELGKIRMTLSPQADGTMTMTVNADRPETLDLLRRNIGELARDLQGAGFSHLNFSFGQDRAPAWQPPASRDRGEDAGREVAAIPLAPQGLANRPAMTVTSGGLDLRL